MPEQTPSQSPRGSRTHWWIWLLAAGFLFLCAYAVFYKDKSSSAQGMARGPMVASVAATEVKKGDIGVYLTGLGSVTPLNTVTVKSRVDGELMKIHFTEGQIVRKGDLLAEIDTRPFDAQLTQAEGQMIRDQALLANAKLDLERYKKLAAQDSIAKQQYDTQKSLVQQLEGTVKVDQGQIDNARLQIVYCRITAPVNGRVGLRQVDQGNIIHASDANGLVVITQLQPITVVFALPEDNIPALLGRMKSGEKLQVDAYNREDSAKVASGHLLTVDNQIDPTTGTVNAKAQFENKHDELFPRQFVNARLLLKVDRDTNVAPVAAIQRSPQGPFVYVVKADNTVEFRRVTLGPTEGDEVSVESGLAPGERVVTDGAERLRDGAKVELRDQNARTPSQQDKQPGKQQDKK